MSVSVLLCSELPSYTACTGTVLTSMTSTNKALIHPMNFLNSIVFSLHVFIDDDFCGRTAVHGDTADKQGNLVILI